MADRVELQKVFEKLLGSRNVYYDPTNNTNMKYDAIRYSKSNPNVAYASDIKYKTMNCYEVIVISRLPDNPVIGKLLELPYSSWERHYVADNMHHDVLIIFH